MLKSTVFLKPRLRKFCFNGVCQALTTNAGSVLDMRGLSTITSLRFSQKIRVNTFNGSTASVRFMCKQLELTQDIDGRLSMLCF